MGMVFFAKPIQDMYAKENLPWSIYLMTLFSSWYFYFLLFFFYALTELYNSAVANKTFISIGLKALWSCASCSHRTRKGNICNLFSFTRVINSCNSYINSMTHNTPITQWMSNTSHENLSLHVFWILWWVLLVTGEEPMAKCWCSQWSVAQPLWSNRSKVRIRPLV